MSTPDDERLLAKAVKGDERALRALVEQHEKLIYGLCLRMLRSREDAEEIAAETFLKIWKGGAGFQSRCSVRAMLCTIALNGCRDRLRSRRLTTPLLESHCLEAAGPDERLQLIELAMARLESEDRELLTLYYLKELSYEEIGEVLGITYDVLRTRLVRARKRLRLILGVEE